MKVYYCILFFILGSVLASFYGVLATRAPLNKSIVKPRSHCDFCNHVLSWYELIPIFSYFFLQGKCHKCKAKLLIYEPIVELVMGILFMGSYLYFGFCYEFFVSLFLISLLVLIFISDIKFMIILDSPLVVTSIAVFLLKWYYFDFQAALNSFFAGIILFLFMLFIGFLGKKVFKRDALGGGDIKLSFVIGITLGVTHAFAALVLSTFLALPYATFSLFATNEHELPYGPFLVSALCVVFLYFDKFSSLLNALQFL